MKNYDKLRTEKVAEDGGKTTKRLCINCKHYRHVTANPAGIEHFCGRLVSSVTGEPDHVPCTAMRKAMDCGPTGALFEPAAGKAKR